MLGTPTSHLVALITARVHEAGKSAPPSSGVPSQMWRVNWLPLCSRPQRDPVMLPLPLCQWPQTEKEATKQEAPLPSGPSEAITGL